MGAGELKKSFKRYRRTTAFLCLIGFLLSYYALYVELAKAKDPSYKAMCDFSARISCSLVFTSEYGTGFGIIGKVVGNDSVINQPNGVYGMIMYPFFLLCSLISVPFFALLELILGISGVIVSGYLGCILFYILEDACVVCITTYIVNFFLFICAVLNYRAVKKERSEREPNVSGFLNGNIKKRV